MNRIIPILTILFVFISARATEVSGPISGNWTLEGSPYFVVAEVFIPENDTLVIDPGVQVIFRGHFKFKVLSDAIIRAVGTETDSILFSPVDTTSGWHGIRFLNSSSQCTLAYCILEYGKAIQGAVGDSRGGAIYCSYSSPFITNCKIFACSAMELGYGGGIYCENSSTTIADNLIMQNSAYIHGGGIYCLDSDPIIIRNIIIENTALWTGGGICSMYSSPTINENEIIRNSAINSEGGGIKSSSSSAIIIDNVIRENWAYSRGGGITCISDSNTTISGNVIEWNSTRMHGGGIYCTDSDPIISFNTISNNLALHPPYSGSGGGIYCRNSSAVIEGNIIQWNEADDGGGINCRSNIGPVFPVITQNVIKENRCNSDGGGISCLDCSPIICDNFIIGNIAEGSGPSNGGGIFCNDCNPYITGNVICENSNPWYGGGLYIFSGLEIDSLDNNTFYGNSATEKGGAIYHEYILHINNCIFWDNSAPLGTHIYNPPGASIIVQYSDIQGGWVGEGNIDEDPIFVNPDSSDYNLQWGSPCIDTGNPDPIYNDPDSTRADMGALYFDQSLGIKEEPVPGIGFKSCDCFPNPFNSTAIFSFKLSQPRNVDLRIYDISGREVATIEYGLKPVGLHRLIFDGSPFSSGIYIYRFKAGDNTATGKMILLK